MKKIALIAVLAIAVPAFAWNGFQDTQDYSTPGYHGGGIGSTTQWTSSTGSWNEDYSGPRWGAEWMASNNGLFLKDGDYQFHGAYSGDSGNTYYATCQFVAPAAITLQDVMYRFIINRSDGDRARNMKFSVDVNGGGFSTVGFSPVFGDDKVDPASLADYTWEANDWKSLDWRSVNDFEVVSTYDLSALNIQAGDTVKYRYQLNLNAPNGGNSKSIGIGVALPEPATMSLLALGGLALIRRRK